jgi:ERO1-like protein beta
MCGNIACAVNTLDNEEDIPLIWRSEELSKLEGPKAVHPGRKQQVERGPERPLQGMLGEGTAESCVMEYDDECDQRDYCVPEDESATGKGDYVSLVDNPERFTGYVGASANQVWDAIYRENCFSRSSFPKSASLGKPKQASMQFPAANELKFVMQGGAKHAPLVGNAPSAETGFENEDECLEKRVFYRVVSGMHASISAHICQDSLNQLTGQWGPNLTCYRERLHAHPERIANLYFNYALVVRAVAKLGPFLSEYTYCSGDTVQDAETKSKVLAISAQAAREPNIFDESQMFVNGEGPSLKEDFRNRFRNISRMMDCVGCDKCRLWGKLQTNGYGTALKVLFEFDNPRALEGEMRAAPQLKRTELVALFNTLARISSSIDAVGKFREMVDAENCASKKEKGEKYFEVTDRERLGRAQVPGKSYTGRGEKEKGEDDDDDDDEDIQKFIEDQRKRRNFEEESVWTAICNETWLIYRIVLYIIRQWIAFPQVA